MIHSRKVALSALLLAVIAPASAAAQDPTVIETKKPNILILLDTSGSMEFETGSTNFPRCYPDTPLKSDHTKSRWVQVLEVLTGPIEDYACAAVDRSDPVFIQEFSMQDETTDPPDAFYRNPYHRPLSYDCAITADHSAAADLTNAFNWAPPVTTPYPVNLAPPLAGCPTPFTQTETGFIDTYTDLARFGLMTFDPLPDPQRGHSGTPSYSVQPVPGVTGTWSYYGGSPAAGKPANCDLDQILEVGARNGAAPATEGKMIYFGNQDLPNSRDQFRHDRLQKVLLGTRPYGATPLNGMLEDARHFFRTDPDIEPTGVTAAFGTDTDYGTAGDGMKLSPRFDEYVDCGCRPQHIILISDGEPNLDLRPHCEELGTGGGANGNCPFSDTPAEILADLAGGSTVPLACSPSTVGTANEYQILTHVIGYATLDYTVGATTYECEDLRTNVPDWNAAGGTCDQADDNEDLRVCCVLHELAAAGSADGNGMPHLAPTGAELQTALANIMKDITNIDVASATQPVRSPGVGLAEGTSMRAFRLLTSYTSQTGTSGVWGGNLERMRWTCDSGTAAEVPKEPEDGDDFGRNLAENIAIRELITFEPDLLGGLFRAKETLRPHLDPSDDDGAGARAGVMRSNVGTGFANEVPPGLLELDYLTDPACTSPYVGATAAASNIACRDRIVNWTVGFSDGQTAHRCPNPNDSANCWVLGDILHSTPKIVDRPTATVDDETYETFAEANQGRYMMAYVSSNDGIFHGFATSPNSTTDESIDRKEDLTEQFAFIPPAVLPKWKDQYPSQRLQLLDGKAVTQDVVATAAAVVPPAFYPFRLERGNDDIAERTNTWRTILVQAFGGAQPGYFALDITDTRKPSTAGGGPIFLWQLTTSSTPAPLFGTGGQPIIATVNIGGVETAVAVLPGGNGGSPLGGAAPRNDPSIGSTYINTHFDGTTAFAPREQVRRYAASDVAARSLTVVRLDNGQIIRRFVHDRANNRLGLTDSDAIFGTADPYLDSPITGTPAAYPAGEGLIADRVFVGDQDGTMWRVDLSNPDPELWKMQLFFDAYPEPHDPEAGKPIVTAPVLSVDDRGQITVAFATGEQDLSGISTDLQYVYSLTETENVAGTGFVATVNWFTQLTGGEHVLGPISLLGGVLYFSTVDLTNSNVCTAASSKIWGVDYVRAQDLTDLSLGGVPRLQPTSTSGPAAPPEQFATANDLVSDANGGAAANVGTVFGVALEYAPSCSTQTVTSNGYILGSRTSVTNPSPSDLRLVFQTGSRDTAEGALGFATGFASIPLVPPRSASTILSWAAVIE